MEKVRVVLTNTAFVVKMANKEMIFVFLILLITPNNLQMQGEKLKRGYVF